MVPTGREAILESSDHALGVDLTLCDEGDSHSLDWREKRHLVPSDWSGSPFSGATTGRDKWLSWTEVARQCSPESPLKKTV